MRSSLIVGEIDNRGGRVDDLIGRKARAEREFREMGLKSGEERVIRGESIGV